MKCACVLALLLSAGAAFALDREARNGSDSIRLQGDCPAVVLALLPTDTPPRVRDSLRAAHAHVGGQDYQACWQLLPSGMVFVIYEDGDRGLLPFGAFRAVPEA
jgi:hypothetical protein